MSAPEPDSSASSSKSSGSAFTLTVLALLVLIYPLSVGPVAKYYTTGNAVLPDWVPTFYAPLEALAKKSPQVEHFFEWYVHLWIAR